MQNCSRKNVSIFSVVVTEVTTRLEVVKILSEIVINDRTCKMHFDILCFHSSAFKDKFSTPQRLQHHYVITVKMITVYNMLQTSTRNIMFES